MFVFYDSKLYFWWMLELMFFVFIILHAESSKIKIMKETQIPEQIQLQEFMLNIKQNPQKFREIIELRKK